MFLEVSWGVCFLRKIKAFYLYVGKANYHQIMTAAKFSENYRLGVYTPGSLSKLRRFLTDISPSQVCESEILQV